MNERNEFNFSFNSDEASDYENLVAQILAKVNGLSQAGFEQLVVDLLIRMG